MKAVVQRAASRSTARNAARTGADWWSPKPKPWIECTTTGTRSRRAASRPRMPALEEWVCTMSGRSRGSPAGSRRPPVRPPRPHLPAQRRQLEQSHVRQGAGPRAAARPRRRTPGPRRSARGRAAHRCRGCSAGRPAELQHGDDVQHPGRAHEHASAAATPSWRASSMEAYFHSAQRPASTTPAPAEAAAQGRRPPAPAPGRRPRSRGPPAPPPAPRCARAAAGRAPRGRPGSAPTGPSGTGAPIGTLTSTETVWHPGRRHAPVVGGDADPVEREALLGHVQPVLAARRRPLDAEVEVEHRHGAQRARRGPGLGRQVDAQGRQVGQGGRGDQPLPLDRLARLQLRPPLAQVQRAHRAPQAQLPDTHRPSPRRAG